MQIPVRLIWLEVIGGREKEFRGKRLKLYCSFDGHRSFNGTENGIVCFMDMEV